MSVWRRRAIESFPELRRELNDRHEIEDVYGLWMEYLLPLWSDARRSGNDDVLDRVHGYADWCFQQPSEDLWNSAAVCFYEHILDEGSRETVLPWLSDATIRAVWGWWEYRLSDADMAALRNLLHEQNRPVPAPDTGTGSQETPPRVSATPRSRGGRRSSSRGTRPRRDQRP